MKELAHYSPEPPKDPTPPQTPSTGSGSTEVIFNAFSPSDIRPRGNQPTASSSKESPSSASASSSGNASKATTSSAKSSPCRRLMDSHDAMSDILSSVMQDAEGVQLNVKVYMKDKVYDQFNDGVVIIEGHIKDPTGSGRTGQTASAPANQAASPAQAPPPAQVAPPDRAGPSTTPGDASASGEATGDTAAAAAPSDTPGDAPEPEQTVAGATTAPKATGKRKADEVSELRSNPRPRRMQKKTVNHGMLYPY